MRLTQLVDIATPFEWGEVQRERFATRFAAAQEAGELPISPVGSYVPYAKDSGVSTWDLAKQATRDTIGGSLKRQYGNDCWLLPRYCSLAALQAERSVSIPPRDRKLRRERLTVLLGHEMALPWATDPQKAFDLAIELAKDGDFQRARRELNTKQEMIVIQEQSGKNDALEFADLVADFNRRVTERSKDVRNGWIFTVIKAAKEMLEYAEKPFSSLFGAVLEITETATEEQDVPPGPMAVFHHTKRKVFDPARTGVPGLAARLRERFGLP